MVAGSRRQEIRRHLPVFRDAVAQLQQTHPRLACVVPMLPSLMPEVRTALQRAQWPTPLVVVPSEPTAARYAAMTAGDVALAASGSVALQLAAARVPMVVGYRLHPFTQLLAPLMASVRCVQAEAPLLTPHHTHPDTHGCVRAGSPAETLPARQRHIMNHRGTVCPVGRAANSHSTLSSPLSLVDTRSNSHVARLKRRGLVCLPPRYVSLPNIFLGFEAIPEALFFDCTAPRLAALTQELLHDPARCAAQRTHLRRFLATLAPTHTQGAKSALLGLREPPSVVAARAVLDAVRAHRSGRGSFT
jgi:lipid A disaccharide synthetase